MDVQQPPQSWIAASSPVITELRLALSQVNAICRLLRADVPVGKDPVGCAIWGYGGCIIVVPKIDFGVDLADQDRIREHETAHCKGWRH